MAKSPGSPARVSVSTPGGRLDQSFADAFERDEPIPEKIGKGRTSGSYRVRVPFLTPEGDDGTEAEAREKTCRTQSSKGKKAVICPFLKEEHFIFTIPG